MAPLVEKHERLVAKWHEHCEIHQKPDSVKNCQFALFFFAEREAAKARIKRMNGQKAKGNFRKLGNTYY
jgi:hypothetical protein